MRTRTGAESPASPSSESSKLEPEQDLDVDETSTISSISTKGPIDFSDLPGAIEIHPQNANLSGSNNQQFIKRPLNAYMIWTVEQRQKIQKEPRQKMNEVSRAMGEVWKKMSQAEKAPYFAMAKKYAEEHKKALKENPNLAYVPSKKKMKLNKNDKEESMSMPSSPDVSDSESPAPSSKPFTQPRSYVENVYARTSNPHLPSPLPRSDAFTYQTRRIPSVPPTAVEATPGQPYRTTISNHYPPEPAPVVHSVPSGPIVYSTAQPSNPQPQPTTTSVDPYAHSLNRQQLHERYYSSLVQYAFPSPFAAPSKIKQEPNYYYDLLIQSRYNNGYNSNAQFQLWYEMTSVATNNEYKLIPLLERPDLIDSCIDLLNQEWPRSRTIRENSLKRCMKDQPDMSFLLMSDGNLIGHVRLCRMPEAPDCWIESVIVNNQLRGKGIGRILLDLVEERASKFGFTTAYLSTHDKMGFYEKCGYSKCPPVLTAGAASKLLLNSGLNSKLTTMPSIPTQSSQQPKIPNQIGNNVPIPPPLPVALISKPVEPSKIFYVKKPIVMTFVKFLVLLAIILSQNCLALECKNDNSGVNIIQGTTDPIEECPESNNTLDEYCFKIKGYLNNNAFTLRGCSYLLAGLGGAFGNLKCHGEAQHHISTQSVKGDLYCCDVDHCNLGLSTMPSILTLGLLSVFLILRR